MTPPHNHSHRSPASQSSTYQQAPNIIQWWKPSMYPLKTLVTVTSTLFVLTLPRPKIFSMGPLTTSSTPHHIPTLWIQIPLFSKPPILSKMSPISTCTTTGNITRYSLSKIYNSACLFSFFRHGRKPQKSLVLTFRTFTFNDQALWDNIP